MGPTNSPWASENKVLSVKPEGDEQGTILGPPTVRPIVLVLGRFAVTARQGTIGRAVGGLTMRNDGYKRFTERCPRCGEVVYRCAVGNGAGLRYARHYAAKELAAHLAERCKKGGVGLCGTS